MRILKKKMIKIPTFSTCKDYYIEYINIQTENIKGGEKY